MSAMYRRPCNSEIDTIRFYNIERSIDILPAKAAAPDQRYRVDRDLGSAAIAFDMDMRRRVIIDVYYEAKAGFTADDWQCLTPR